MWEPHLSLLMLKGNVEVFSAYQEWSSWAGGAGLVGHRHGGEHGPEKSREGLRAAAGGETAPSKAWGTNHSGDVPIPQLLLEPSQQSLGEPQPTFSTSPRCWEAGLGRKSM